MSWFAKKDKFPLVHEIKGFFSGVLEFVKQNSDHSEYVSIVTEAIDGLERKMIFLAIGEVKAGKSSFINALLGENICNVSGPPCSSRY